MTMARKVAGAVVLLLLFALLLSSSADASPRTKCTAYPAKNPSCGTNFITDGTCAKQCKSEGYRGWICLSSCSCVVCPPPNIEHRPETLELQKQGNKGALAADVGAV